MPSAAITCGQPDAPLNGSVDVSGGTFYKCVAVYSCDEGFVLTGAQVRTCTTSGWSGTTPNCSGECVHKGATPNGVHSPTLLTRVHTTTQCVQYTVTSAMNIAYHFPFLFKDVDCGMPEDITNGTVTTSSTVYNSNATYTCDPGYVLVGLAVRVCEADGSWSNAAPACERRCMTIASVEENDMLFFSSSSSRL